MNLKYSLFALLIVLLASCGKKTVVWDKPEYSAEGEVNMQMREGAVPVVGTRSTIVEEARKWLGTPYRYGGEDKGGVDCSGMVMKVYLQATGVKLPRSSREQQRFCRRIEKSDIDCGDLVFFSSKSGGANVSHVGIYIGDDKFIHSSTSRGVIVSSLAENYYVTHYHSSGCVDALKMREDATAAPCDTLVKSGTASARPGDIESEAIRDAVRRAMLQ